MANAGIRLDQKKNLFVRSGNVRFACSVSLRMLHVFVPVIKFRASSFIGILLFLTVIGCLSVWQANKLAGLFSS